jgi:hypothetical protein
MVATGSRTQWRHGVAQGTIQGKDGGGIQEGREFVLNLPQCGQHPLNHEAAPL